MPNDAKRNQIKPSSQPAASREHTIYLHDCKEDMVSPEILSMQRRIREEKQKVHDARADHKGNGKAECDTAKAQTDPKQEVPAKAEDGEGTSDDWEELDLADVQASHLEAMDLTDLSPSLLEHTQGPDMDYSAEDEKILERSLEKMQPEKPKQPKPKRG